LSRLQGRDEMDPNNFDLLMWENVFPFLSFSFNNYFDPKVKSKSKKQTIFY
jgi:hypothetical protein